MTSNPMTWVAITAATVPLTGEDGTASPERRLAGIGLLIAEHDQADRWRFKRHAYIASQDEPHDFVLEAVGDQLPPHATPIGWNVDQLLVPTLLDAARTSSSATVAHHFAARLHRLLRGGAIDMALCHGGVGAPPLQRIAIGLGVDTPIPEVAAIADAAARNDVGGLSEYLADEALVLWKVFVRSAGLAGVDAERATDAWLHRRALIRSVKDAGSP